VHLHISLPKRLSRERCQVLVILTVVLVILTVVLVILTVVHTTTR
jgi:hypothetical protein